jgi:hypothetical protein
LTAETDSYSRPQKVSRKWIVLPVNSYSNSHAAKNGSPDRMGSTGHRHYHQHSHGYSSDPSHYWHLHTFGSPAYWWWSTW